MTAPEIAPGLVGNRSLKVRGKHTLVHFAPSNGKPDINPIRQVAKRLGITRREAARLLLDARVKEAE